MRLSRRWAVLLAALAISGGGFAKGVQAQPELQARGASSQIAVKAKPHVIYETIKGLNKDKPEDLREIFRDESRSVLEERFRGLPIIGDAVCVYEETYRPYSRIDYKLVRSDKFKAFEGCWELEPAPDGSVTVRLRAYTDTGLRIPFARQITDNATMRDVRKRLSDVKATAEQKN